MSSSRLDYIDAAKGLGIMLVAVGHFTAQSAPLWYDSLWSLIFLFHMPLFFFLSGMTSCLSRNRTAFKTYFLSRTLRLLVPYLVASLCYEAMMVYIHGIGAFSFKFLYTYPGKQAVYLWFLPALWLCSLVSYPLVHLKLRFLFPIALLSFFLLLPSFPHLPGYLNDCRLYLPYVLFGSFWWRWQSKGEGSSSQMIFALLTLLMGLVLCNYLFSNYDLSVKTLVSFLLALLCTMCVLFAFQFIFTPRWIVKIGMVSMLIYLLHPMILYPFKYIYEQHIMTGSLSFGCLMVVGVSLSCFVPYILDRFVGRFLPWVKVLYGSH